MTRTHKLLLAILTGVVLLVGGSAYATYRVFTSHGLITVDVSENVPQKNLSHRAG